MRTFMHGTCAAVRRRRLTVVHHDRWLQLVTSPCLHLKKLCTVFFLRVIKLSTVVSFADPLYLEAQLYVLTIWHIYVAQLDLQWCQHQLDCNVWPMHLLICLPTHCIRMYLITSSVELWHICASLSNQACECDRPVMWIILLSSIWIIRTTCGYNTGIK